MISFCKKTLHTFQSFSYSKTESSRLCQNIIPSSPTCGLSLIAGDCRKPANVLDSASVKKLPSVTSVKKDPCGGSGCLEDFSCVGPVDGLSSCTESLGFESCDQMEEMIDETSSRSRSIDGSSFGRRKERERLRRREEAKNLPPPLSSLNRNGQPSFFLKPVRKDGRLQLVEVRIDRPEIFRASRQDGRLRLHFIGSESEFESESESEVEEEIQVQSHKEEGEGERDRGVQWKVPLTSGDGFRRCHDLSNHHLLLWNHQCVTSR